MTSMIRVAVATPNDALAEKIRSSMTSTEVRVFRFESLLQCCAPQVSIHFDVMAIDCSDREYDDAFSSHIKRHLSLSTPTIAIISEQHAELAVKLLDAGIDRCLPMSFDQNHFSAVVRALTRRHHGLISSVTEYGALSFHHDKKHAYLHGVEVELTSRESQVLEILLKRVGQIVSKETFIEDMGSDSMDLNTSAVEVYIHRLRKKISGDVLPIRNIKRCGYFLRRFTPELTPTEHYRSSYQNSQLGLGMR